MCLDLPELETFAKKIKSLPKPPNNTIKTSDLSYDHREYLTFILNFSRFMKLRFAEIEEFLNATEAVLKASIYKNNNRFRNDKGFKGLKMIKRTLERIKDTQFKSVLSQFSELMPLQVDIKKAKNDLYLPSGSILEHLLSCHISAFLEANKLIGLCEYTSAYLQARIRLGHFWNWALFNFANTSRLWTLGQSLLVYLHLSYKEVRKLMPICDQSSTVWLPENIKFPEELIASGSPLLEKDVIKQLLASNDVPVYVIKRPTIVTLTVGEEIERDSTSQQDQQPESSFNKKQWIKLKAKLGKLKTHDEIIAFLNSETDERHACRKKAITKKMQQSDWKLLKSNVKKSLSDGKPIKTIKQTLEAWIICPKHQGDFCNEVKALK